MKKLLIIFFLAIGFLANAQTTPASKVRSNGTFTEVDHYASFLKRLGIPTGDGDHLDNSGSAQNSMKLRFNRTLNRLRLYDPITATWRDAGITDLSAYYKKPQVDSLLAYYYKKTQVDSIASLYVPKTREINTGFGLNGGGDLAANKTLSLDTSSNGARSALNSYSKSQTNTQIANAITAGDFIPKSQKAANNGVATLASDGKIPNSQIPSLAISETFVVNSQAEMLGISGADQGDVAVRNDLSKSFILTAWPASVLSNWQVLLSPTDAVQSVNGQVGNVNLTTTDISEGTNKYFTSARHDYGTLLNKPSFSTLYQQKEDQRLSTTNSPLFSGLTTSGVISVNNINSDGKIDFYRTGGKQYSFQHDAAQFYLYNNTDAKIMWRSVNDGRMFFNYNVTAPTFIGDLSGLAANSTLWRGQSLVTSVSDANPNFLMTLSGTNSGIISKAELKAYVGLNDGSTLSNSINGTSSNSTLWNNFAYNHASSTAVDTYVMGYNGSGVYGPKTAAQVLSFLGTSGVYQPLENQRLSTTNRATFKGVDIVANFDGNANINFVPTGSGNQWELYPNTTDFTIYNRTQANVPLSISNAGVLSTLGYTVLHSGNFQTYGDPRYHLLENQRLSTFNSPTFSQVVATSFKLKKTAAGEGTGNYYIPFHTSIGTEEAYLGFGAANTDFYINNSVGTNLYNATQHIFNTSITAPTFIGALNGNATTATNATTVTNGVYTTTFNALGDARYYPLSSNPAGYLTAFSETDSSVPAYAKTLTAFSVIKTSTDALYQPVGSYLTTETDPVYLASSWYSTTNNSSNWNTAYGWGNHAGAGYVTASSTNTFTNKSGNISQWANDSGYLTSISETDPTLSAYAKSLTAFSVIKTSTDPLYRPITYVPAWGEIIGKPTFSTVATSGDYNDLTNKPTLNIANWNTAFSQTRQWDGGATGLIASTARASLGGTTVGQNFFTLANPSAITFTRINADNTVTALSASDFRTAIGAGAGGGTVTNVTPANGDITITNSTTTPVLTLNSSATGSSNTIAKRDASGNLWATSRFRFQSSSNYIESDAYDTYIYSGSSGTGALYVKFNNGLTTALSLSTAGLLTTAAGISTTGGYFTNTIVGTNISLSGSLTVAANPYASGWNGSFKVATEDAVFDKIESLATGGGTWGSITGPLSSQTDLNSALNARLTTSAAASTYLTIGDAASTYLTTSGALSTFLQLSGGTLSGALSGTTFTATGGFFDTSDIRLKNVIDRNFDAASISKISYRWKSGPDSRVHVGYSAQDVSLHMPDAVKTDEYGQLSVNYTEVLVQKVAQLEARVKVLEGK